MDTEQHLYIFPRNNVHNLNSPLLWQTTVNLTTIMYKYEVNRNISLRFFCLFTFCRLHKSAMARHAVSEWAKLGFATRVQSPSYTAVLFSIAISFLNDKKVKLSRISNINYFTKLTNSNVFLFLNYIKNRFLLC